MFDNLGFLTMKSKCPKEELSHGKMLTQKLWLIDYKNGQELESKNGGLGLYAIRIQDSGKW